jgi:signal transduction histidine kinase
MKIRSRLTLYFTALVTTLILTGSVITYFALYTYNQVEFHKHLYAKALTRAELLFNHRNIDSTVLRAIDRTKYDVLVNENIEIYDSLHREVYTNNDTVNFYPSAELLNKIREEKKIEYSQGPFEIIGFYEPDKFGNAIIMAGATDKEGRALLKEVRLILITIFLASVILVLVMGWFFVSKSLEPISTIVRQVRTLSPVENSERLPSVSENDEIAYLISTFNHLFDKLEDSFKLQKNFVANVSHELNNPLTKIKSQIEVSLIQKRENESYRHTMHSILEDVNELITLVHDLMKFSRVSSESFIAHTPIRIDELLFEIRDTISEQIPEYNIYINFTNLPQSESHLIIYGNKQLLITAIKNIVDNACKYSKDKSASLNLVLEGEELSLSIADNGPGIPAADLPHIFELFYRASSMDSVKGFGIGLALAKRIFNAHQFAVKVQSAIGVGTAFIIKFTNN